MDETPDPGTEEAAKLGCTCPIIDNHYGAGYHGEAGVYMYSGDCPIHHLPDPSRVLEALKTATEP